MSLIVFNSASNPINHCRHNEKLVLHMLRQHHRESKANLARLAGLTAAAIGGIVTALEEKGLIRNVGKIQGDMGKPATLYALLPEGAYGIGVSINRGYIETIFMDFVGQVVASKKHRVILPAPQAVLTLVLDDIASMAESLSSDITSRLVGIGVAQPYNISSWSNDNQDWLAWDDFDLASNLSKAIGLPAQMQNDANAGAIAELIYGEKPAANDFLYFYFGSPMVRSLGGAAVLDGECRSGASGNAGDIGLMPMPVDGRYTKAINSEVEPQLLTHSCSLYSLVCYLRSLGAMVESHDDFDAYLRQYSADVDAWLEKCVFSLTIAVQSFQALVDVPEIIIDCEDADAVLIERIIADLNASLSACSKRGFVMPVVRKGSFGSQASAIGAATVPLDTCFSPK
ncbi:ROK family transcriptional regulator [Marinagarivorans cellulosilyticus]|nr:ROK family transcriptional regulator [Marinagarivorans cellulosilyticus]